MPHVTFIHGLANKPEAEKLYEIWLRALAKGDDPLVEHIGPIDQPAGHAGGAQVERVIALGQCA